MGCRKLSSLSKSVWARKKKSQNPPLLEHSGLSSSSPQKRYHCYTLPGCTSEVVACLTYCLHRCCKHASCSRSQSWLRRLSVIADLCAATTFGINQAYQRDSCLFTCYKHLPAPSLCSISAQIIYRHPASVSLFTLLLGL